MLDISLRVNTTPSTPAPLPPDYLASLNARDRAETIIHEVGHLTVALALGYPAEATIRHTETDDPRLKRAWAGSCRINFTFRPGNNRENTMIALAGWLAKVLHDDPDADLYDEVCSNLEDGPSDTDLAMMTINNRWIVKWAEDVKALLIKYAAFRAWAAERLSNEGFISEHEAVEAFPAKAKLAQYRRHRRALEAIYQDARGRSICPSKNECNDLSLNIAPQR